MQKYLLLFLVAIFLIAGSNPGSGEATKKYTKATFKVRAVLAKKGDKDAMDAELKDISDALKRATVHNTFTLLESYETSAEFGEETSMEIAAESLKVKFSPTKVEKDTLKGTVSVIKAEGKKFSVLCKANIDMKLDGVLCIVPSANYEGGELIIAIKLIKFE